MGEGINPHKIVGEFCETCRATRACADLTQVVERLAEDLARAKQRIAELERFLGKDNSRA